MESKFGFGGSLIPVLLRSIAEIMDNDCNPNDYDYIFNAEKEELTAIPKLQDNNTIVTPY